MNKPEWKVVVEQADYELRFPKTTTYTLDLGRFELRVVYSCRQHDIQLFDNEDIFQQRVSCKTLLYRTRKEGLKRSIKWAREIVASKIEGFRNTEKRLAKQREAHEEVADMLCIVAYDGYGA